MRTITEFTLRVINGQVDLFETYNFNDNDYWHNPYNTFSEAVDSLIKLGDHHVSPKANIVFNIEGKKTIKNYYTWKILLMEQLVVNGYL